ncbi:MAG TPA: UDP-N-acetylmuramyl-tripeptide synthetase [Candidatus Acidoferrum sp.]|nr:UDP-N-acetylmuramyl-tripeptide synthetase [Candidatus Acidoferrum sp.]
MPAGRVTPDRLALAHAYAGMRRSLTGVRTIAVTGTKGKTSTTEFIGQFMAASGLRTAVSTTESARIGATSTPPCEHLEDFVAFVARCRRSGIECLVVELCSSALTWNVHRGLDLDAAVLTNIGTDHISNHGNVRNYVAVKRRLFRDLRAGPASARPVAILNADEAYAGDFRSGLAPGVRLATYGLNGRNGTAPGPLRLRAGDIAHGADGTSFTIHGLAGGPHACRTRLHGDFNVSNVLAAVTCAVALGGDERGIVQGAEALVPPPGRFTIIAGVSDDRPAVVVDYAHTPESVDCALAAARDLSPRGRIHAVFGCGGDCYKAKRPLMGAVAAREADSITLTSDNPRTEDPQAITRAILRGIPASRRRAVRVELDRARAIDLAVAEARGGDVVILLGKGAEQTQEVTGKTHRFSDAQAARRALRRRGRP